MTYPVDIYADGQKIATGRTGDDGMIADVAPFERRGLGYGRRVQITVTADKHAGSTITGQIMGEVGTDVTLKEPLPFK